MKDKAKEEHQEGSEAIADLKKLTETYSKLQADHLKLQQQSEERYKVLNKRYKKTQDMLTKTK